MFYEKKEINIKKYYAVEYAGFWNIQYEDKYSKSNILDADVVGKDAAKKYAKLIVELLNKQRK